MMLRHGTLLQALCNNFWAHDKPEFKAVRRYKFAPGVRRCVAWRLVMSQIYGDFHTMELEWALTKAAQRVAR